MASELYAAFRELKAALAAIEAHPENHPPALRAWYRATFDEIEDRVMAHFAGAEMGAQNWCIAIHSWRPKAQKIHLADDERAKVSLCGLDVTNVRYPTVATLGAIRETYAICQACDGQARIRERRF